MTSIKVFIPVSDKIRYLAKKYKVPEEVLASIKAEPEKLAKAYKVSIDRQYLDLLKTYREFEILGRVQTFKVVTKKDGVTVVLRFPTTDVVMNINNEEWKKHDVETWYRLLTDWIYVKCRLVRVKRKERKETELIIAEKWRFVKIQEDRETFLRLIEIFRQKDVPAPVLTACVTVLRYNHKVLSRSAWYLLTARLLPLVSVEPLHGVEFTIPGTGKTSVALLYNFALRWVYFNEPPTPASLAGDARTGRSIVAGANGVWFDEVDKWGGYRTKREKVNEVIEILLTAMEQGLWRRGAGGEKQIEVHNHIPIYFSGNVTEPIGARTYLRQIVEKCASAGAGDALNERIAFAICCTERNVADNLQHAVLPNSPRMAVLRGMVSVLQEMYTKEQDVHDSNIDSEFKGRFRRHYKRVAKALAVLYDLDVHHDYVLEMTRKFVKGVIIEGGDEGDNA